MTRTTETPFSIRRALAVGAAALTVQLSAAPALAQMVCGNHETVKKRLQNGYNENRTGIGLAANGGVIELYTSGTGTFTIILTRTDGMSCLMAVGENWEQVEDHTPVRTVAPLPVPQALPPA